jgi:hypothetical protein
LNHVDYFNDTHNTPRQVGRPGKKLGDFERHLFTRGGWHFAFFTSGKSAVNQSQTCTDMNLAHNVFITDILFQEGV